MRSRIADTVLDIGVNGASSLTEKAGWTLLTTPDVLASTRVVFDTGEGTVVKIASIDDHKEVNKKECQNWEQFNDPSLFAPIVDAAKDYSWVEMKKCWRPSGEESFLASTLRDKAVERGYSVTDVHYENVGILPDSRELVKIDYPDDERI